MLMQLADTLADARSLEDLVRPVLEMIQSSTGFESVYLTSVDMDAGVQHVMYSHNSDRLDIPEGLVVPWEDSLCRRAQKTGITHTQDVPGDWPDSGAAQTLGLMSYLSTPVLAGERRYGTLSAASERALPLGQEGGRLLQMFARLIGHQIEREELLSRLRQSNAELSAFALTDPLTGIPNRRAMLAELGRALARMEREACEVHVAFIDLDGFKTINDRLGHEIGDRFLAAMAHRITASLRKEDFAARYGGDEFVVLAVSRQGDSGEALSSRLAQATRGVFDLPGHRIDYAGPSIGMVRAWSDEDAASLLMRADAAMYAVKQARRAHSRS